MKILPGYISSKSIGIIGMKGGFSAAILGTVTESALSPGERDVTRYLRLSPNTIAHLLVIATFLFIVLIAFGLGRPAHASAQIECVAPNVSGSRLTLWSHTAQIHRRNASYDGVIK